MKKGLSGVLAALLVLALFGCGNSESEEEAINAVDVASITELSSKISADPRGGSVDDPVWIRLGPDISSNDLEIEYEDSPGLYDGIGGLFKAFGDSGKYVALDLRDITWTVMDNNGAMVKGIPGATSNDVNNRRPNVSKLVDIKLPKDLVIIEARAFVNCTNLKKLDLRGQSRLQYIDEYAFYNPTSLKSIDFSGCTSLKLIGGYAFTYAENLETLDLAPCTSLTEIGGRTFRYAYRLKYVEFPASLRKTGDYSMDYCYSLKYIRFRTATVALDWGWSTLLYSQNATDRNNNSTETYNGLPASHRMYAFESKDPATMQMYVIYHPNTIGWTQDTGTYYADNQEREFHQAHHVPLPYSGNPNAVYAASVDALRGEALLKYSDEFRGQKTVKVNASGLADYNGKKVTSNIGNNVSGTISGGAVAMTIPEPSVTQLQPMDTDSFSSITGLYGPDKWYNSPRENDDWTVNGYSSTEGKPWIWPRDAQFAVLDLSVQDGGTLMQYGKSNYKLAWVAPSGEREGHEQQDVRVVKYVYVDKDVSVFRYTRSPVGSGTWGTLRFVYLSLKKGWNQLEVKEEVQDSGTPSSTRFHTSIWVSGGLIEDDSNGPQDIREQDTTKINNYTNILIPSKPIPWAVRMDDPWSAIVSPDISGGPTLESPHRN
jgi:hypothetical protein